MWLPTSICIPLKRQFKLVWWPVLLRVKEKVLSGGRGSQAGLCQDDGLFPYNLQMTVCDGRSLARLQGGDPGEGALGGTISHCSALF